jgi:hypothetical protein
MGPLGLGRITIALTLLWGHYLLFWETGFHKIKGGETLSRSHNHLNTADDNTGLRASLHLLSGIMHVQEFFLTLHRPYFLNPFTSCGASGLLPKLGYCEQCCSKHGCASGSIIAWSTFLQVYTQGGFPGSYGSFILNFFEGPLYYFP